MHCSAHVEAFLPVSLCTSSQVDPHSFHFGAAVRSAAVEKWTCQIFKALPAAARLSEEEQGAFMQRVYPQGGEDGRTLVASMEPPNLA